MALVSVVARGRRAGPSSVVILGGAVIARGFALLEVPIKLMGPTAPRMVELVT